MVIRPVHIWWIGFGVFAFSTAMWVYFIWLFASNLNPHYDLSRYDFTHIYFPILAALAGVTIPLYCLRRLGHASLKRNLRFFLLYSTLMLAWGISDIKRECYQIGGHDYPNGILTDGHRYYWHLYFTWYFLPYRLIHGYDFH